MMSSLTRVSATNERNACILSPFDICLADDLNDLRLLLEHVKDTAVLVLLQSKGVLTRPWVILELFTALTNNVPVVSLNVHTAFLYDYGTAMDFLLHFDEEIDIANPGAAELLIEQGVDPVDVAWPIRPPEHHQHRLQPQREQPSDPGFTEASLEDLADQMRQAPPSLRP